MKETHEEEKNALSPPQRQNKQKNTHCVIIDFSNPAAPITTRE
jgi:hypothetical protein